MGTAGCIRCLLYYRFGTHFSDCWDAAGGSVAAVIKVLAMYVFDKIVNSVR